MKIAVTAQGNKLESAIDPRFGRCQFFVITDSERAGFEAIPNDNSNASGGAGIATAQKLVDLGVEAVITGNVGPNAMRVLQGAGIKVYNTTAPTVKAALEEWHAGNSTQMSDSNVRPHFGMGRGRGRGGNF